MSSNTDNPLKYKFASINQLWGIKKEFRLKIFFLASTFALLTGVNAIWRPLKIGIFCKIVGAGYIPTAKLYALLFLIPLLIFYSKLVDWLRRHQLLYCYTLFQAIGGLIFYFVLAHPVYGVANTNTSPERLAGWFFYFFMESMTAFLSTVFWSFADSVNNHKDAKNYYGILVSGSKIGGIIAAGILYLLLTYAGQVQSDSILPNTMLAGSLMMFAAAISVYFLIKKVPENRMHGYEAAYQLEKRRATKKTKEKKTALESLKGAFEGVLILLKNPYVLGIFSIVAFYEVIIVILDFRLAMVANVSFKTARGLTSYYALYYLLMNAIGLGLTLFGTVPILKKLGIRATLFIFPAISAILILITLIFPATGVFFTVLVLFRSLDYAFNHPTREILYIPTTKSVKFKAKAWSDAFGTRLAKGGGSVLNLGMRKMTSDAALMFSSIFIFSIISIWAVVVFFLGKIVHDVMKREEVIGAQDSENGE